MLNFRGDGRIESSRRVRAEQPPLLVSRLNSPRPYRVGEPWRLAEEACPEGSSFQIDRKGYTLDVCRSGLSEAEVQGLRFDLLEFSLVVEPPLIVLGYRLGPGRGWESVPYAWPLADGSRPTRVVPPSRVEPGTRALLWITLVSADDGLIRAQRGVPLDPEFSAVLNGVIRAQAKTPLDGGAYVRAIARIYCDRSETSAFDRLAAIRTSSAD